jgi:hypothetical protein
MQVNLTETMISNPFIDGKIISPNPEDKEEITHENVYKYYQKVYLLLPLDTNKEEFNSSPISVDNLRELQKNLIVIPKKINLLRIPIFFEWTKRINKIYLNKTNLGSLDYESLEEYLLVLPIFLFPYDQMLSFFELFKEKDWFENLVINYKIAEYLKISPYYSEIKNQLETVNNSYWTKESNCKINFSESFKLRNFKWKIFSNKAFDKTKTIEELKKFNLKDDNYMSLFFKSNGNFDKILKTVNFKLHRLPKVNNLFLIPEFNEFFTNLKGKQRFILFNNILLSPEYQHLLTKNPYIWTLMSEMIQHSKPLYRYLLFYFYLSLYLQENIKKTFLTQEDSSILSLDVACQIPNFPYLQKDQNSHPAIAVGQLIQKKLYSNTNFYGMACFANNLGNEELTLSNTEEFKQRLNIFMTGNSKKNIFSKVNFDKIYLTGSMISACVPKKHPLMNLFTGIIPTGVENPVDYLYYRYFCEYYSEADVDVLIAEKDNFKFYEKVQEFKKQVAQGIEICNGMTDVSMTEEKIRKGYLRFNLAFVTKTLLPYWKEKGIEKTTEEILTTLNTEETIKLFLPFYQEKVKTFYYYLLMEYENKEEIKTKYSFFFEEMPLDLIILDHYENINDKKLKVEEMEFSEEYDETEIKTEPWFDVRESIKYRLSHPILNHHFECFSVPFEDPWSCINKFHLGQVRGYYNGSVYLSMSCLMALQTNLSPDYRSMFGSKDPGEILNKYRMRGFGAILNENELAQIMKYSEDIPFWKNLYLIDSKKKETLVNFSNHLHLGNSIFQPRLLNSDFFETSKIFVIPEYKVPNIKYLDTLETFNHELSTILNKSNNPLINYFLKQNYLNYEGYPIPIKKWLVESSWDIFEMDRKFNI